ncbi:putative protein QUIRKY [Iris pallida]|uniref:C2 domain-containing protein n=1 Tax=Iris pallida TaxID=29817 RepID=A0AAX6FXS6_IRIPA|nr:putative protein QUIRKY [Iris pallida]
MEKMHSHAGVHAAAAAHGGPAPPPGAAAAFMMRPPPAMGGLVETSPPLAGRARRRPFLPLGPSAPHPDKISSTYDLVEQMHYLYVHVVKARALPARDLTGSLDPYVEVRLGNYKGVTRVLESNPNPHWNQVFAFSKDRLQASFLEVVVKDKDMLKDDVVGRVGFDLAEVPVRVPPDSPLAPQWYRLHHDGASAGGRGEIMLAVWMGTQADEAFPDAWHSDAHSVPPEALTQTRSKVYFSPRLCYLRVHAIEAQDLVPASPDDPRPPDAYVKVQLGGQMRRTRPAMLRSANPVWNEEVVLVAAEPLDEPLVITVEDRVGPSKDEPIGRLVVPVSAVAYHRTEHNKLVEARWYSLGRPTASQHSEQDGGPGEKKKESSKFSSKIHLRIYLDLGYHVLDESTHYSSDLRPSEKNLRKPSIGILEVGILSARNLVAMKAKDGRATDAYCIAKYGPKWVRTRTILSSLAPRWNEQYTWEVFDPCTVITVGVFDNNHVGGGGKDQESRDQRIGKIRIRLSTLETDRVYTHYYPLLVLQPSGLKKTGELHLAVRFTCTAWVNMVALYGKPLLPKMHYIQPIPVIQLDYLRHQAMQIVSARLSRAEPPLRREAVEYMLDVDSHMWSLRRSKANFYRITSLLCGIGATARWFDGIRNWRNPLTTILVHVLFLMLVCYPELILPTAFLYMFLVGIWNYRFRPRNPPHMDTKLSHAELAHPDELDEEFDTFPTSRPPDVVRMRYDRMRSVAGRVQSVVGDLATQGERAHALLSWRDPRATAIFVALAAVLAVVLYVTPFQVLAVLVGLYLLRHPKFRTRMPSVPYNYYRRLPAKSDMLL